MGDRTVSEARPANPYCKPPWLARLRCGCSRLSRSKVGKRDVRLEDLQRLHFIWRSLCRKDPNFSIYCSSRAIILHSKHLDIRTSTPLELVTCCEAVTTACGDGSDGVVAGDGGDAGSKQEPEASVAPSWVTYPPFSRACPSRKCPSCFNDGHVQTSNTALSTKIPAVIMVRIRTIPAVLELTHARHPSCGN